MADYILLTGATGGTGAVILEQLLAAGHTVNAILRSFAESKEALSSQYKDAVAAGKLHLTEIPDMAAPHAFHAAAQGASAIIHAATPIASSDFEKSMIKPTYAHLDNVLEAAKASGTVKRVIVTGSIVSTMRLPQDLFSGATFSASSFNSISREEATADTQSAYQFSKVSSEHRAWSWMADQKTELSFDLVYLLAPVIIGKSIQVGFVPDRSALGGTGMLYRELFDREKLGNLFPYYMDVEDVAGVHVAALDRAKVQGGKRYLLRAPGVLTAANAANKIREVLPELKGRVPAGEDGGKAEGPEGLAKVDTRGFDETFGTDWRS